MTITGPDARSAAPGQAAVDAALLLLERMGPPLTLEGARTHDGGSQAGDLTYRRARRYGSRHLASGFPPLLYFPGVRPGLVSARRCDSSGQRRT
jgi:hypothetical protein